MRCKGVITTVILDTAAKVRVKDKDFGKGWGFYRVFKRNDTACNKDKVDKRFGFGVRVFTLKAEMVGRLMLLISSKEAGNESTDIDNKIVDILDNFRSIGLLTSDEYEILHNNRIASK